MQSQSDGGQHRDRRLAFGDMSTSQEPRRQDPVSLSAHDVAYVGRLLRSFGVAPDQREDLQQDILLCLHRSLSRYEGRAAFKTWVYAVASRAALRHKRRSRQLSAWVELDDDVAREDVDPERMVAVSEHLAAVSSALAALDADKRALIESHVLEGVSIAAIARREDVPLQTVYTRLSTARGSLRAALGSTRE